MATLCCCLQGRSSVPICCPFSNRRSTIGRCPSDVAWRAVPPPSYAGWGFTSTPIVKRASTIPLRPLQAAYCSPVICPSFHVWSMVLVSREREPSPRPPNDMRAVAFHYIRLCTWLILVRHIPAGERIFIPSEERHDACNSARFLCNRGYSESFPGLLLVLAFCAHSRYHLGSHSCPHSPGADTNPSRFRLRLRPRCFSLTRAG